MQPLRRFFKIEPITTPGASATTYVPWVMASRALAFVRTLLVARLLGRLGVEFGIYQTALEFINPIVAVVLFGAADVAERYVGRIEGERGHAGLKKWLDRQFLRIGLTGLGVALAMAALWPWASHAVWGTRDPWSIFFCGAAVVLLAGYQHISSVLRGLRAYRAASGMELLAAVLLLLFSVLAAFQKDAVLLIAAYTLSIAIPLIIYNMVLGRHLAQADLPCAETAATEDMRQKDQVIDYASDKTIPSLSRFAAWSLVRLLLVMMFGFLAIWGVRFMGDQGRWSLTSGSGHPGAGAAGQFAAPFRIAQLLGFLAVTLWASSYGIAARAWSEGRVRRAQMQFFRLGKFGVAALAVVGVGLLLCRGLFEWALPDYAESIERLLPGMIALFIWYGMVAFFSSFADLHEKPQRGAALWGTAVLVQAAAIVVAWWLRWKWWHFDSPLFMLVVSAAGLATALVVVAPVLLCRPLRFSATGVPLVLLGVVPVTLFCPGWVVDWIAGPVMLGSVGFLHVSGLLIRPVDRRAFRRWRKKV